jgi:hypothetical protein
MPMPFALQPTVAQTTEMQRISLQMQQQQLLQLQQSVAQYAKSIDDALDQIRKVFENRDGLREKPRRGRRSRKRGMPTSAGRASI